MRPGHRRGALALSAVVDLPAPITDYPTIQEAL